MKCSRCGKEIPDGYLYCEACGKEVHMVPEFEPEIENQIDRTLSSMAEEIRAQEKEAEEKKTEKRKRSGRRAAVPAILAVLLTLGIMLAVSLLPEEKTAQAYKEEAAAALEAGDTDSAAAALEQARALDAKDADILLLLAECQERRGQTDEALQTLEELLNSAAFTEEAYRQAYEKAFALLYGKADYTAAKALLESCPYADIREAYALPLPSPPAFSVESGVYEEALTVTLNAAEGDEIYYTVNGDAPQEKGWRYEAPLLFEESGTYLVRAVAVGQNGLYSETAEREYQIEIPAVSAPQILEESGNYDRKTLIVAAPAAGATIYYTTDGSVPTQASEQYTAPLRMPFGDSVWKFVAYDENGNASEVTEREYHLHYPARVTQTQAVEAVIDALVKEGELLDREGNLPGGEGGRRTYGVHEVITLPASGDYYEIYEFVQYGDGENVQTDQLYAVDTWDGGVYRISSGADGSLLVKIS